MHSKLSLLKGDFSGQHEWNVREMTQYYAGTSLMDTIAQGLLRI